MVKTIAVGTCVFIQGVFVRKLADGKMVVRVGQKTYTGTPVTG